MKINWKNNVWRGLYRFARIFIGTIVGHILYKLPMIMAEMNLTIFLVNWQGALFISLIVAIGMGLDKFVRLTGKDINATDKDDYMTLFNKILGKIKGD